MRRRKRYLIRRRNRFGQWVHLATWETEPTKEDLANFFGPGNYSISIAEEGVVGLIYHGTVVVPWKLDLLGWIQGEPTLKFIEENYGPGNYFAIGEAHKIIPFQIYSQGQPHDWTWQLLQDGKDAMKDVYTIYRVYLPWL
jgi:hypothetical protein